MLFCLKLCTNAMFWGNITYVYCLKCTSDDKRPWEKSDKRAQIHKTRWVRAQCWPAWRRAWSFSFWLSLEEQVQYRADRKMFLAMDVSSLIHSTTKSNVSIVVLLYRCQFSTLTFFSPICSRLDWRRQNSWRIWVPQKFCALPSVSLYWVQLLWRNSSVWWVGALCCTLQTKVRTS